MKKVISILVAMLLSIGIIACGENKEEASNKTNETKEEETKKEEKDSIETLKGKLKEAGLDVGESSTVEYRKIGATSGQKFKVNDEMLEVYYYDQDKLTIEDKKLRRQVGMEVLNTPKTNLYLSTSGNFAFTHLGNCDNQRKLANVVNIIK